MKHTRKKGNKFIDIILKSKQDTLFLWGLLYGMLSFTCSFLIINHEN